MKKVFTFVALALGVILGSAAGTAHAYPPNLEPILVYPTSVAPGAAFSVSVENGAPGAIVVLEFEGTVVEGVLSAGGAAFAPLASSPTGSFTAEFTAPTEEGSYPLTADLSTGESTTVQIVVKGDGGDDGDNGGDDGDNGGDDGGDDGDGNKDKPMKKPDSALPSTGGTVWPGVALAFGALAGGAGLLFVSKRRTTA